MKFIDPATIIAHSGIKPGDKVADFGCGTGFYAVAASKAVGNNGVVLAIDVKDSSLAATKSASIQQGSHNVQAIKADLEKPITLVEQGSQDVVIVGSILHEVKNRDALLKNAFAVLKTGGSILAVDWKTIPTPFGPPIEKRISEEDLQKTFEQMGLEHIKTIPTDSYHYAMIFKKH